MLTKCSLYTHAAIASGSGWRECVELVPPGGVRWLVVVNAIDAACSESELVDIRESDVSRPCAKPSDVCMACFCTAVLS